MSLAECSVSFLPIESITLLFSLHLEFFFFNHVLHSRLLVEGYGLKTRF